MGCADCIRIAVFLFNLVFAFAGLGLITLGVFYILNIVDFSEAIPALYKGIHLVPIFTISVGGAVFLIAFFGCCGAYKSSPCLLTTYAVILLTIFMIKIAIGVYAFLGVQDRETFEEDVNKTISQLYSQYGKNDKDTELVDTVQEGLHCCGTYGPKYWNDIGSTLPNSCCEEKNCKNVMYTDGCQKKFSNFLYDAVNIIAITILCLSATEVLGAIIALCLANSIRNDLRRSPYLQGGY